MKVAERKYVGQPVASEAMLKQFLNDWPNIDAKTGLCLNDDELLIKSREAMLFAVQTFNNPSAYFKAEMFIVSAIISWTYLLHYYYRENGIDYTHKKNGNPVKTDYGANKLFELSQCVKMKECPLDDCTKLNLEYLIGIRHEIEHQKTSRIDYATSAKLQACCLNHNRYIKNLFGDRHGLDKDLSLALQFSGIDADQQAVLKGHGDLPAHIKAFNVQFEQQLSDDEYNDPRYAYRIAIVPKLINNRNKADVVYEIVQHQSDTEKALNVVIKEREKTKYLPTDIVKHMHAKGFTEFNIYRHTTLWQKECAKDPSKGFGVEIAGKWYWYDTWLEKVLEHINDSDISLKYK